MSDSRYPVLGFPTLDLYELPACRRTGVSNLIIFPRILDILFSVLFHVYNGNIGYVIMSALIVGFYFYTMIVRDARNLPDGFRHFGKPTAAMTVLTMFAPHPSTWFPIFVAVARLGADIWYFWERKDRSTRRPPVDGPSYGLVNRYFGASVRELSFAEIVLILTIMPSGWYVFSAALEGHKMLGLAVAWFMAAGYLLVTQVGGPHTDDFNRFLLVGAMSSAGYIGFAVQQYELQNFVVAISSIVVVELYLKYVQLSRLDELLWVATPGIWITSIVGIFAHFCSIPLCCIFAGVVTVEMCRAWHGFDWYGSIVMQKSKEGDRWSEGEIGEVPGRWNYFS